MPCIVLLSLALIGTALNQSLSKCLTAQDTRGILTLTEHNRTLARLGYLLYLQRRSSIKVKGFFLSLGLSKSIKKLDTALNWYLTFPVFPFLNPNKNTQWLRSLINLFAMYFFTIPSSSCIKKTFKFFTWF